MSATGIGYFGSDFASALETLADSIKAMLKV
jgi:hypothetical protein